jgi:hypothetical protein
VNLKYYNLVKNNGASPPKIHGLAPLKTTKK